MSGRSGDDNNIKRSRVVSERQCRLILSDIACSDGSTASEKMKAISLLQGFRSESGESTGTLKILVDYNNGKQCQTGT